MRIVVLVKPVPDTAVGRRAARPATGRLDRAATPAVVNGNDEYALEAALKLVEAHGGEVTLLSMARRERARDDAQGAGDGRGERDPRDRPGARRLRHGLDDPRPRRRRSRTLEYDLVLAGADTSDGGGGVVPPGVADAARAAVPLVRGEDRAGSGRRHGPRPPDQPDRLRRPRGADAGADRRHAGCSASRATRRSRGSWPPARRRS